MIATQAIPEYTEELPLLHMQSAQYLMAIRQAAWRLRWRVISASGNIVKLYTSAGSFGEVVTITIEDKKVIFHSRPVNEYYWPEGQDRVNASSFKKAIALVVEQNNKATKKLAHTTQEQYGALVPSKTYLVTPAIAYLNVLVFLCMTISGISPFSPTTSSLLSWGGNFAPVVAMGEWWRLLTYMFLHAGFMHLFMNMFALMYIGLYLEPLLGKFRFGAAYLLTGICAGLLSITMHKYSVGVGASGAIFGMYGIFFAMLTTSHIEKTVRKTMLRSILFFVVFNLLSGLQGNTDNAAHIGGLLSGIAIGYIYYPGLTTQQSMKKQLGITAIITAAVVLLCIAAI